MPYSPTDRQLSIHRKLSLHQPTDYQTIDNFTLLIKNEQNSFSDT